MNKQNIIVDIEDILKTYKYKIPEKQFRLLNSRGWLPLIKDSNVAIESAYLMAKVMGDGNLDKSFTCRFIGQMQDLMLLKDLIEEQFHIDNRNMKLTHKKAKGHSYMLQVNDSLFGRFLWSVGAPQGNKTKMRFQVPTWILKSKEHARFFLQGLFDDELSTITIKRESFFREAALRMCKIEKYQENLTTFLSQIVELTNQFSVQCSKIDKPHFESIQKDGCRTYSQSFRILGSKANIINFRRNIGYRLNKSKLEELEKSLEYVRKMRERGFEPR